MLNTLLKKNWLTIINRYALLFLSTFLLAFIPLYPKLPLFELIEGYIVRARLEDVFIAITIVVYFIQLLRKKISLQTPLTKIIFVYIVIGFLSTLSGIFITQTIPATEVHLLKSFLHFARYIEYFSLFFITTAAITTKKDFKISLTVLVLTLLGIGLYGLGQKYLFWPVYSTMNREFSTGMVLYLTEHAKVQSTFGGHYDMAAYLVIVVPIVLSLIFYVKNRVQLLVLWSSYLIGLFLMILSSARTSLAGLVAGLFVTIFIVGLFQTTLPKKLWFMSKHAVITTTILTVMILAFGDNMSERITATFESYPPINQVLQVLVEQKQTLLTQINIEQYFPEQFTIEKPENGISLEEAEVLLNSDTQPSPVKPRDVYVDVPNKIEVATISAQGEKTTITIEVPRTYSENAQKHGLSLAIRLDTLWPQAINGFLTNPLLGTGYATLTKSQVFEFTEADSTDNNYLRTLGETGLLGFLAFYGCILLALKTSYEILTNKSKADPLKKFFAVGFIGATIGLLLNATFIDVFAASKVAYTYWAVTGMLFALQKIQTKSQPHKKVNKKNTKQAKKRTFKNI